MKYLPLLFVLAACMSRPTTPEQQSYFDAVNRVPSAPTDQLPAHEQAEVRPLH